MAHSKFSMDDSVFEDSTGLVLRPDHIMPLPEEEQEVTVSVANCVESDAGTSAGQEEQGEQAADATDNPVLETIMQNASRGDLHGFQEYESYAVRANSDSDSDVPEDDEIPGDETDLCSGESGDDEDEVVPVKPQGEKAPAAEGYHFPGSHPVDDGFIAIVRISDRCPSNPPGALVEAQGPHPEGSRTSTLVNAIEYTMSREEEEQHPSEEFLDRTSRPGIIQVSETSNVANQLDPLPDEEDPAVQADHDQLTALNFSAKHAACEENEPITENLQEDTVPPDEVKDHGQPSPIVIQVVNLNDGDNISSGEGIKLESREVNLHGTLVNAQVSEPEAQCAPTQLGCNIVTLQVHHLITVAAAGVVVIGEYQLDVGYGDLQDVTATSAADRESWNDGSSIPIPADVHEDPE